MDRSIIYDQAQARDYDILWAWRNNLIALSQLTQDLLGSTSTVVAGFAATQDTPADLSINLAAGDIYQLADIDATAYGSLSADTAQVLQQGIAAAQKVTLSTSGLSTGQSRWALIEAAFSQSDEIPSDDPNGGVLPYLNANNPSGSPWSGPNNSGSAQNTRRLGTVTIKVLYGNVATTGSEVPPNPDTGYVPLYLIDIAFGQTQVTQSQILTAGPSVGTGVPSNYTSAPFIKGLSQLGKLPYLSLSTSQTLTPAMQGQLIANGATGLTFTLPAGSSAGNGALYSFFQQNSSDTLAIASQGTDKIYGPNGWAVSSITLTEEGQFVSLSCDGGNWHVVGQAIPFASNAVTAAGTDAHSAVTPAGLMSVFGNSFVGSGYQKLPSGLIIQWGIISTNASGVASLLFPIAFPNGCFTCVATPSTATPVNAMTGMQSLSGTGVTIYCSTTSGSAVAANQQWIAIGH